MTKYKKYNLILGWTVFAVAAITYILTMEPTASLWDCGEFIATSYKLEVGHPPGAPFFMLVQKIVSLLAGGNVHKVAVMMNLTSAISSAFTILFLFWSISYIARKILLRKNPNGELTDGQLIAVLGSALVGALAYTFSDSFWFSAVEAEVYAMSSMFTALVFWLVLKWDEHADEPHADKWLILIAYLSGLAIGVHLLNLLVIPSIALIYYFKRYKATVWGSLLVFTIGVILVAFVMYGIIQGIISIASKFELFFVNTLGLPFDSGFLFFIIALIAGIVWVLWWSKKKNKPALHSSFLALLMLIIGYSSFAMLVIRSSADPPIDENDPENTFALKAYLDREQYGDRPLLYGQYYDAQVIGQKDEYTYYRGKQNGKPRYIKTKKTNPHYIYDPQRMTFFPRMYSAQQDHIKAYKSWGGVEGTPTFANNMKFFFSYQVGFMYFRYFFWNFVGKQNDIQGHGGPLHGNWLSGIKPIDNALIAPQDHLPDKWKNMASRNKYYFLPLILGLIGFIFQIDKDWKSFSVILALFFMTGLAIVIYLNQTPYQPRERDYAYVGSFYAYAMWIGLSVLALFEWLKKYLKNEKLSSSLLTVILLGVPILMGFQNWDDHSRAHRYHTRDLASDYLNSCAKDAILFTYGDNDTFPLWYDQEVEGIRTDVRDVNLSLFSTDWYANQMKRKAYESDPIPLPIDESKYRMGVRDVVLIHDNPNVLFIEKYNANKAEFLPRYKDLYARVMKIINKSNFAQKYPKDYNTLNKGYNKLNIRTFLSYVKALNNKSKEFNLNADSLKIYNNLGTKLAKDIANSYAPIKAVMDFVTSDDPSTKLKLQSGIYDYLPTRKILIPVNKEHIKELGFVPKDKMNKVQDVKFTLKGNYLLKANWLVLEMLAYNNWNRPIYFATSIGSDNYMGLDKYFRLEGFAYRLVPYKVQPISQGETGDVNIDILYNNVMNKFKWGNIKDPRFNVDNYVQRTVMVMDIRNVFHRLAEALISKNKTDSAKEVLDKCIEELPDNKIAYDYTVLPIIEDYYKIGDTTKANAIALQLFDNYNQQLQYFASFPANKAKLLNERDIKIPLYVFQELANIADKYGQKEITNKVQPILLQYMQQMVPQRN